MPEAHRPSSIQTRIKTYACTLSTTALQFAHRPSSIQTRIKTRSSPPISPCLQTLIDHLPFKQGLRLTAAKACFKLNISLIDHLPFKQGLRPRDAVRWVLTFHSQTIFPELTFLVTAYRLRHCGLCSLGNCPAIPRSGSIAQYLPAHFILGLSLSL